MSIARPARVLFAELTPTGGTPADLSGWPSHLLQASAKRHDWEGIGLLSIKMFLGGTAYYEAGRGHFAVDDSAYLVLNHAQKYAITIDAPMPVESFCLFFRAGIAEEVRRSLVTGTEHLLDEPLPARTDDLVFFERTHPHDDVLSPLLFRLRETLRALPEGESCEPAWLEEQMYRIVERLLPRCQLAREEEWGAFGSSVSMRAATRTELYRRLHRARDFAAATSDRPLSLNDMAREACLSPNHFLRSFKALFHETPHQLLIRRRLATACRLLSGSDLSVTEICLRVGFFSLGSFSRLFTRRFGLSPERYRRENGTRQRKRGDFG